MSNIISFPDRFEDRPIPGETLEIYCERTGISYTSDNMTYFDEMEKQYGEISWLKPIITLTRSTK